MGAVFGGHTWCGWRENAGAVTAERRTGARAHGAYRSATAPGADRAQPRTAGRSRPATPTALRAATDSAVRLASRHRATRADRSWPGLLLTIPRLAAGGEHELEPLIRLAGVMQLGSEAQVVRQVVGDPKRFRELLDADHYVDGMILQGDRLVGRVRRFLVLGYPADTLSGHP